MSIINSATILLPLLAYSCNAYVYQPVTGLGEAPELNTSLYISAARNPLRSNSVSFAGFNFTGSPSSSRFDVTSSRRWILQANYSTVIVNDSTPPENNTVPYVTYDFILPNGSIPLTNDTDWTLCRTIYMDTFPSNVTGGVHNQNGDCSQLLGQDCLRDYMAAFEANARGAISGIGCPNPPFWTEVPSCYQRMGFSFGTATSVIGNYTTEPNIGYRGGGYYNLSDPRTPLPANFTPQYHGLQSYQTFTYAKGRAIPASENQTVYTQEVGQVRMMMLSFVPSQRWRSSQTGGYSVSATQGNRTRLICLQIDPTTNTPVNAAHRLARGDHVAWMSVFVGAVVVLSQLVLW